MQIQASSLGFSSSKTLQLRLQLLLQLWPIQFRSLLQLHLQLQLQLQLQLKLQIRLMVGRMIMMIPGSRISGSVAHTSSGYVQICHETRGKTRAPGKHLQSKAQGKSN